MSQKDDAKMIKNIWHFQNVSYFYCSKVQNTIVNENKTFVQFLEHVKAIFTIDAMCIVRNDPAAFGKKKNIDKNERTAKK